MIDVMKTQLLSYEPGRYQVTNKLNFNFNFHFRLGIVQTHNPVINHKVETEGITSWR